MEHELKIWPQYFQAVYDGRKTFEVRVNDRGFQAGDSVILHEWDNLRFVENSNNFTGYTGRKIQFEIGYVYPLDDGRVVFSLINRRSDWNG